LSAVCFIEAFDAAGNRFVAGIALVPLEITDVRLAREANCGGLA